MNDHVNIFKIERLRIETDGEGVRSLVCFSGCPLRCKYCLNKSDMNKAPLSLTPEELRDSLAIDDIYFKASSVGGVTFGGGEPSVHSEFIEEFRQLCPPEWTLYIETSLNVPKEHVKRLAKVIDHWYIDIKDMNDKIYRKYTGSSNKQVIENLQYLIGQGLSDSITVRVPLIPDFNSQGDVDKSVEALHKMGIFYEECFAYHKKYKPDKRPPMGIPEKEPPLPRPIFYVTSVLIGVVVGILCAIMASSKVMAIFGAVIIGLLVTICLCIIVKIVTWIKIHNTIEDKNLKIYEGLDNGRD